MKATRAATIASLLRKGRRTVANEFRVIVTKSLRNTLTCLHNMLQYLKRTVHSMPSTLLPEPNQRLNVEGHAAATDLTKNILETIALH